MHKIPKFKKVQLAHKVDLNFPPKVTKVTTKVSKGSTEHQKWPKMDQNCMTGSFLPGRRPKPSARARSCTRLSVIVVRSRA